MKNKYSRKNKNKTKLISLVNRAVFSIIIISGIFYVVSINDLAIKSFVLEDLKEQSRELLRVKENYEFKVMSLESYDSIDKRAQQLKMVKVDKINYLSTGFNFVAKK